MKKSELIKIIKEELGRALQEDPRDALRARADAAEEFFNKPPPPPPKTKPKPKPKVNPDLSLPKKRDKYLSQLDRASAVLKIIAPGKPRVFYDKIRMSGKGDKMFLNKVAVPVKYINFILNGGEMPK